MKTIKKFRVHINIIFFFIVLSCKENIRKEDDFSPKGSVREHQILKLKNNKWRLRRYFVIDNTNRKTLYKKDINNVVILSFTEKDILKNNLEYGKVNYNTNNFILYNIDTITNKYHLFYLKENQLILKNNILYYKNDSIIKNITIELNLSTDTISNNTDYYNIVY